METAAKQTAPALIAKEIRQAIIRGEIPSGKPLRQTEIADRFGVSRIPVREALSQLEGEGWVSSVPHRGVIVTGISGEDLRDVCDIRMELESRATLLAVPRITDEQLLRAELLLTEMDTDPTPEGWNDSNIQFHMALYGPCERPRLLSLIVNLHHLMNRYLVLEDAVALQRENTKSEHRSILSAFRARDAERAAHLVRDHIDDVVHVLEKFLPAQ
ncbi:MAG: GntR family transcriptional regulator [Candidatus Eremiobacteraeota bacterium]|nr:GntR family transcriptional regulator [Candidatus Eremiobacteraeota bacterium]